MSAEHHSGKGYAPLPQCLSNSDTEEDEEHLSRTNNIIKHKGQQGIRETESTLIHENGTFYPLDETRNLANRARNGQNTLKYYRDDIPIMVIEGESGNDLWKRRDMSPLRRFCLILSILLCLVTILVFLYVLPCDDSMVCPPVIDSQSSISWDKTLEGVELHGPISVIPGSPYNLIFLLRGQRYGRNNVTTGNQQQISSEGSAVISMQGSTGIPLWWVSLKRQPTDIDCNTIDTDQSGKPDCIVVGEQGLLASIEPTAGTIHWSSAYHTFSKLPVILPDINSDGVGDLLSVETSADVPNLVLLSGKNGQLLGKYEHARNCSNIDIYSLASNGSVTVFCTDSNGKGVTRYISLTEIITNTNTSHTGQVKFIAKSPSTAHMFPVSKIHNDKNTWNLTQHHYLTVENLGDCPGEQCSVYINLTLQKSKNQSSLIWDHVSKNSVVTRPAFLTLDGPYTTGFAIKFWQWLEFTPDHMTDAVTEKRLVERVMIVIVNYTDVQVINASQSEVLQLCRGTDCQPNPLLRTQSNAIALVQYNGDGLPQLINYWSSYNTGESKVLTSKVQVVKMDSVISNVFHPNNV